MKIAQVANPWVKIPPTGYGGTERVVHELCESLISRGHDVTLYATGDSRTSGKLIYFYKKALGNSKLLKEDPSNLMKHLEHFFQNYASNFDLIHYHAGRLGLPYLSSCKVPFVITCHTPFEKFADFLPYKNFPYVSISNAQRRKVAELNFVATVYNGVELSEMKFSPLGSERIVWLGRIGNAKGVDLAIDLALRLKKEIAVRGFVDEGEKDYFDNLVGMYAQEKLLTMGPEVVDANDKSQFLGNARLLLYPLRWNEPFGIVMIEALACGTPVVVYARGSAPEVVKDGETGFLVNPSSQEKVGDWVVKKTGVEGLYEAVTRIYNMDKESYDKMRVASRRHVEENFTVEKMVSGYEEVYKKCLVI